MPKPGPKRRFQALLIFMASWAGLKIFTDWKTTESEATHPAAPPAPGRSRPRGRAYWPSRSRKGQAAVDHQERLSMLSRYASMAVPRRQGPFCRCRERGHGGARFVPHLLIPRRIETGQSLPNIRRAGPNQRSACSSHGRRSAADHRSGRPASSPESFA
jgi:hypothetical protein